MTKFIKNSILFISLFLISLTSIMVLTNKIVEDNLNLKLNKNIKYIVIGNSHPECAFNDTIIQNFKNVSNSGESYFYTFQKTKKILKQNKHLETVFVEFSNIYFVNDVGNTIWGKKNIENFYPLYAPFINTKDNLLLMEKNFPVFLQTLPKVIQKNIYRITSKKHDYSSDIGGYKYLVRDKTDSLVSAYEKSIDKSEYKFNKSIQLSAYYLARIVNLCKKNGKNILFIRSPQHKYLFSSKNDSFFLNLKDSIFPEIEFLDFNNFNLENNEFGDFGHLNHKGAKKFSLFFNKLLSLNLLEKKDKTIFINKMLDNERTNSTEYKKW